MTVKRVTTLLVVMLAVLTLSLDASARKFGGSKSWGKSYKTAPQQSLTTRQNSQPAKGAATTTPRRPGMMGGLLGGLLAGGLFAWLLGSGAFQGIQFMDVLILAVIAFVLFRLARNLLQAKAATQQGDAHYRQQPSPASSEPRSSSSASAGSTNQAFDDVPFDLPAGFDMVQFLEGARGHYNILQKAWNNNDLTTIKEYLVDELYQQLVAERASYGQQILDNEVLYVDASLVRAETTATRQQVSVHFTGKYRQEDGREAAIDEIWHLRRDLSQSDDWLIEGISEQGDNQS